MYTGPQPAIQQYVWVWYKQGRVVIMYGGMRGEGVGGLDLNLGIHCFILFGSERNLQSVPSILKGIHTVHSI